MSAVESSEGRGPIGCQLLPSCAEDTRRERVRLGGSLNGIDYVEVGDDGVTLCVHLFGEVPEGIGVANVRASGGDRIVGLRALSVREEREPDLHDDVCLRVVLDREGDYSPYCLCLVDAASGADPASWIAYPGFDPRYACAELRFRLGCGRDLDCAAQTPCVKPVASLPEINYLARDYESFRQLFLDRMALNVPAWQERHVPDIGVAMIEVMAYVGRLPLLLPGRRRHRGLSADRQASHLGATSRAPGGLPHARGLQCEGVCHPVAVSRRGDSGAG